jgi:hypothetical protein
MAERLRPSHLNEWRERSGVSPVVPVLLLLFSWYLWAFFQTWRLRFSDDATPGFCPRVHAIRTARENYQQTKSIHFSGEVRYCWVISSLATVPTT